MKNFRSKKALLRECTALLRKAPEDNTADFTVSTVRRPPFWGKYLFSLSFSFSHTNSGLQAAVFYLIELSVDSSKCRTVLPNVLFGTGSLYFNDPEVLKALNIVVDDLRFNSVRVIADSHIDKKIAPKVPHPYYQKYPHRIEFPPGTTETEETIRPLMEGAWKLAGKFLYCELDSDAMMARLMHDNTALTTKL